MTACSAARLALKIALFTPSAGSLSESASSALGGSLDEVAHPVQSSNRPRSTAHVACTGLPRSALRTARNTVILSVGPSRGEFIVPGVTRRVKAASGKQPQRALEPATCRVVDQLRGRNVFYRDPTDLKTVVADTGAAL